MKSYTKLLYADFMLKRVLNERARVKEEQHKKAVRMADAGHHDEALALYRSLLEMEPKNAAWWHELSLLQTERLHLHEASIAILKSLAIDSSTARSHFDFGKLFEQLEDKQSAFEEYVGILCLENAPKNRVETGEVLKQTLNPDVAYLEQADELCHSLIAASEEKGDAFFKLGHVAMARNQIAEAVEAYESAYLSRANDPTVAKSLAFALQLQGKNGRATLLLGYAYYDERSYAKAIIEIERALALGETGIDAYAKLANAHIQLSQLSSAIAVCEAAAERHTPTAAIFIEWVFALRESNRKHEAKAKAASAAEFLSDPLFLAHVRYLSLPIIYKNASHIEIERSHFIDGLQKLCTLVEEEETKATSQALQLIKVNFYLGYQGHNDLALQQQYGSLIHHLLRTAYPKWCKTQEMPSLNPGERIRVGYISSFFRNHTVAKLFLGWLADHDTSRFEIFIYYTGSEIDLMTQQYEKYSDHFLHLTSSIAQRVIEDKLHILVHPEIGMDHYTNAIAGLRLAPIQCVAWGHPITTGLPAIDYFISSQLMEPEDAEAHYAENLIRLPGIGVNVPAPYLPQSPRGRHLFGFQEDAVLFLSSQSLFKYLPQHDRVFPAIAARVPNSQFIFLAGSVPERTRDFRNRLRREFELANLDAEKHITFVPPQDYWNYLELNRVCDIYLDTIGWSGGMTTFEAVGCGLPVVTLPGEFMRGRHSYAILKQLGITETIATSIDEYIEIAVNLGTKAEWRHQLSRQIMEKHDHLFDDVKCVRSLEEFYTRTVLERLANTPADGAHRDTT